MFRKAISILLTVLAAVFIIYIFIYWLIYGKNVVLTDSARVFPEKVTISSKYTQRIAEVLVKSYQRVSKGQHLLELVPYYNKVDKEKTGHDISVIKNKLQQLLTSKNQIIHRINLLNKQAKIIFKKNSLTKELVEKLSKYNKNDLIVSGFQFNQYLITGLMGNEQIIENSVALSIAQQELIKNKFEYQQLQHTLKKAELTADTINYELTHHTMIAPINGLLGTVEIHVGELIKKKSSFISYF